MLPRLNLSLVLLGVILVWPQVGSSQTDSEAPPDDQVQMLTPPPVSGESYPTTVGFEARSNYLSGGFILNAAYNDNVPGSGSTPIDDVTYSISPTIAFNRTTPRQHTTFTYSPGFTFYQHNSTLNAANQNGVVNFQYRVTEHTTVSLSDSFQRGSNLFNQPYPLSGGVISGSSQNPPLGVIAPFAQQLNNTANVGLSYQFARDGLVGANGIYTKTDYTNPAQASGLYNSSSGGGSVFYSERVTSTQYIGVTYQYARSQSDPVKAQSNPVNSPTEVQTHTLLSFYTIYLNPTLSISVSCGPQYFDATQVPSTSARSWTPSAMASIGWQRSHTNLVASYSRTVTAGLGLPGAFDSNLTNAAFRWQVARAWIVGLTGSYSLNKNITPLFYPSSPGGHTATGNASIQHSMSEHFQMELGYSRLHQSYSEIAQTFNTPDSNRGFISVTYQLSRPVGR